MTTASTLTRSLASLPSVAGKRCNGNNNVEWLTICLQAPVPYVMGMGGGNDALVQSFGSACSTSTALQARISGSGE